MKPIDKILLGVLACALTLTLIACKDRFAGAEEYDPEPPQVSCEGLKTVETVTPQQDGTVKTVPYEGTEETEPKQIPVTEPEEQSETVTMLATAYCGCAECCGKDDCITATGTRATEGRTIAADPHVLPFGTHVVIDGNEYIVEDCGGGVAGNRLDIYFESHTDALAYGVQTVEAQILEGKK